MTDESIDAPQEVTSDIGYFYRYFEEKLQFMLVDLAAQPDGNLNCLVVIECAHLEQGVDGNLPQAEEEIQQELMSEIIECAMALNVRLVGKIVKNSLSRIYFYTDDPDEFIAQVSCRSLKRELNLIKEEDSDWSIFYKDLYPNENEFRSILNTRKLEALMAEGDNLEDLRTVEHYFEIAAASQEQLSIELSGMGHVQSFSNDDDDTKLVSVLMEHLIDSPTIDEITYGLLDIAGRCNAIYTGWELRDSVNANSYVESPIDLQNWRATPAISGRTATHEDLSAGVAVFCQEEGTTHIDISLPAAAILKNLDTGDELPVVVVQAEETNEETFVGFRMLNGTAGICTLNELEFLDEPDERFLRNEF